MKYRYIAFTATSWMPHVEHWFTAIPRSLFSTFADKYPFFAEMQQNFDQSNPTDNTDYVVSGVTYNVCNNWKIEFGEYIEHISNSK